MRRLLLGILLLGVTVTTAALDVVIVDKPLSSDDRRNEYTDKLLKQILSKTEKKYGPFEFRYSKFPMERSRLLSEMQRGELVNVTAQASRPEWESGLTTIWVPVDKGLSSYRIFLIRRDKQAALAAVKSLAELKKFRIGADLSWSSYHVYQASKFNVVSGNNYEGLFQMLLSDRFDYFPRALYEAFSEYDDRKGKYPELAIEKSLLIFFPLPKYFFVSPAQPRLAQRISEGFDIMLKDGSFDEAFIEYHRTIIEQTHFCQRQFFSFDNPFVSPKTPLKQPDLWYNPFKPTKVKGKMIKPLCQ